jgi:hypothetical protein
MKPAFLMDECTDPALVAGLLIAEASIDIARVGGPNAPPGGTKDPDLIRAAAAVGRVLVSNDRSSMPAHLASHFAAGGHTAGVILLRGGYPLGRYVQEILGQWKTTSADEWIDRTIYLP